MHSFLKKLWKLYHNGEDGIFSVSDDEPTTEELKTLHKTIKKVDEDIANFSYFSLHVNRSSSYDIVTANPLNLILLFALDNAIKFHVPVTSF